MTYGVGGTLWRTVCEIDFTAQTTQNLKGGGDGVKTIAGMTWTLLNSANCTSFDLTNGTGLVIVASVTNTGYTGATRTAPILHALFNDCFNFYNLKDYSIQSHAVRIMARVTLANAGANNENALLIVENVTAPTTQNFLIGKGFNGANNITFAANDTAVQTTITQQTTSFSDDVLGLNFEGPDLIEGWTGIYDSSAARLPYQFNTHRGSYSSNLQTPSVRQNTIPRVAMGQETLNVAGDLTTTFTHFRMDVASKNPPR